MKKVEKMICHIKDEVCGAMKYAENYIFYESTHPEWAKMYSQMAQDELSHADYLHTIYQAKINMVEWMPEDAKAAWESCVNEATEKAAMVRLILSK